MQPDPRPPDTGPDRLMIPQAPFGGQGSSVPMEQSVLPDTEMPPWEDFGSSQVPDNGPPRSRLPRIIAFTLLSLGIIFFLRYQVFTISNLRIIGTRYIPWETVAKSAGLDRGLFYFAVNEDEIKESVNANRYLVFEGMELVFPNTLVLQVRERAPFAFFTHLGIGYVISQDGMVLEQSRNLAVGQGLITVSGLSLWGQISPGSFPASTDPSQAEDLVKLFNEFITWGFESQVRSIDIAHNLNLSAMTIDGYTVNLGAAEQLHAKIGTVQSVVSELRRRQMPPGIIEAAMPGEATYRAQTP